ncbi:thiol-disulfide oxidoreductase DCC family protein [soil metagenome]
MPGAENIGELTTPAGAVILFDGVCTLCNRSVQFIIRRDADGYFNFASLQSSAGRRLIQRHGLDQDQADSVILVEGGRAYGRSDAALRIVRNLGGVWPVMTVFRIVPRSVRDRLYDWIASNRYRWFGRREECMIPTPELRRRFLE